MRSDKGQLQPLLLLFPARTGSTLLMQLLGTSPKVVFDRVYPFEKRYLAFFIRWAWQLADADHVNDSWSLENLVAEKAYAGNPIEPPPFPVPSGFGLDTPTPLWHEALRSAWREFCARASASGTCSPDPDQNPIYYAEKSRPFFRHALQETGFDHKTILLLRDPRDIFLSMWSFNKKRGTTSFSAKDDDTPEGFAKRFINDRRRSMRVLIEMATQDDGRDVITVRYEDMIIDLHNVAARLTDMLGISFDASKVLSEQQHYSKHMSATDPRSSIHRWRREMPIELQRIFALGLADQLESLGYEV